MTELIIAMLVHSKNDGSLTIKTVKCPSLPNDGDVDYVSQHLCLCSTSHHMTKYLLNTADLTTDTDEEK